MCKFGFYPLWQCQCHFFLSQKKLFNHAVMDVFVFIDQLVNDILNNIDTNSDNVGSEEIKSVE
jgi:hypothetical protein